MSTPVGVPHPELPADLATSPGQKRKRASDSSSPDTRRSKRGAPAATMATTESDANQAVQVAQAQAAQVTQTAQAAQSFLDNTVSIAQAAHEHVNVDDFSALAQATAADHSETTDATNATNTAAAALNMYPNLHVSQPTAEPFSSQPAQEAHQENTFNHSINQPAPAEPMPVAQPTSIPAPAAPAPANGVQQHPVQQQQPQAPPHPQTHPQYKPPNPKPAVGSEEWHKMRKDNHKEVERRRRETINEGINELAKIVPGCEKNKGSILQRAVAFIQQLKENEAQNIEKWTLEKLLTEQAIAELSQSNDKLKQECERLYRELDHWKSLAQSAGLGLPPQQQQQGQPQGQQQGQPQPEEQPQPAAQSQQTSQPQQQAQTQQAPAPSQPKEEQVASS